MDITKLMINDWVTANYTVDFPKIDRYGIPDKRNIKISVIDKNSDSAGDGIIYKSKQLEPLALSDEIFQLNGFDISEAQDQITLFRQKDDDNGYEIYNINVYRNKDENDYQIEISNYIAYTHIHQTHVKDVYMLQHLLRNAYLDDIADDLKIR